MTKTKQKSTIIGYPNTITIQFHVFNLTLLTYNSAKMVVEILHFLSYYYYYYYFNWDSLYARLSSHYEAWSYNKRSIKKITGYRKSI